MSILKKITFVFLLLIFVVDILFAAQTSSINIKIAAKAQELNRVNQQIQGLQSDLQAAKTERSHYETQLQTIERTIGIIDNKLASTDQALKKQDVVLIQLKHRQNDLIVLLNQQQFLLAKQIRAAYMLGQHQSLKLLLNQQNPSTIDRLLTYHKQIHSARMAVIKDLNHTLSQLNIVQMKIDKQVQYLQKLANTQTLARQNQANNLTQREKLVIDLKRMIVTKSLQLETLSDNKRALEIVLQKLRQSIDIGPQPKMPFKAMRGHLAWPTRGAILQHFGERIADSSLINNAILIRGNTGDPVRVVYPGKVVFADWLRGLGLLMIVDHGNGYLSLYGHNYSLLKRTGDTVLGGEQIARVGNSGGYEKSGLYFQIRADGKPVNPEVWLKK